MNHDPILKPDSAMSWRQRIGHLFAKPANQYRPITPTEDPFLFRLDRGVAERYRTLAWTLDQAKSRQAVQILTITSSIAGEGKSTVAMNLAAILADRNNNRVLLVDFDLRRPRIAMTLGAGHYGLVEFLQNTVTLEQAIHRHEELAFNYIPTLVPIEDPLFLLANSLRLRQILETMRSQYDYVILDAPPVLPVSDPLFLCEASDATLFVVRAGETSGRMVSRALGMLKQQKLLGLIFNSAARGMGYHYDQYYYGRSSYTTNY